VRLSSALRLRSLRSLASPWMACLSLRLCSLTYVVTNFVTFERLSWEPAGRPMKAQSAGEMFVGIWKIERRAGLPSSPSTTLRRRRLSAVFWSFVAFFSRRFDSEMSSESVSRTARRRAVTDLTSASRRTSSTTSSATTGATGAGTATGAATSAFLALTALTGAAATGAATGAAATSPFLATTLADLGAALIILDTGAEVEDILRGTHLLHKLKIHFLTKSGVFDQLYLACVCFYFEV